MALNMTAEAFSGALTDLQSLCGSLKKYEAAFSPEAKQLFQSTCNSAEQAQREVESLPASASDASIADYLAIGNKTMSLRTALQRVQQAVSAFTSGAIPVPRSSKEELSRLHSHVLGLKFALSSEQQLLITQLRKLCLDVETQKQDFDVIETNLDNTMRNVLQHVHGKDTLEPESLAVEQEKLQAGIAKARSAGTKQLEDMLSLALNSLQRLHATHASSSDAEEDDATSGGAGGVVGGSGGEEEEDDDDDPFFMPMPGAIKWAEASKFKELAKPLAPEQPADKQFMIVMEDDDMNASSSAALSEEPSANMIVGPGSAAAEQLVLQDSARSSGPAPTTDADVQEEGAARAAELTTAASGEPAAAAQAEAEVSSGDAEAAGRSAEGSAAAEPSGAGVAPATAAATSPKSGAAQAPAAALEERASNGASTSAGDAGEAAPKSGAVVVPPPEKLADFVNFLNGENPGACMFHAQMRLSPEGCMKLANFLRSSARVRALSLSHNYLGDAGLRLICDGLRENKSVTALDLPDNNITDVGAAILAESIKNNPSLTQLQLAYNKIGDHGAMALAQVIRTSHSLKKLGLAFNNIGKAGCQALTSAISSNQSLKHMQLLPGNPVEEKDAKALAKALKRNNKFSIKQLLGLRVDS